MSDRMTPEHALCRQGLLVATSRIATLESEVAALRAELAAFKAAQPHGVISDERIEQIYDETAGAMGDDYAHAGWLAFARALLAAAQEGK